MRTGVVVPVHGFVPYLAETLDSVLTQAAGTADVVVVDDGSPEPLHLHPDHATHVSLVRRPDAGGPAVARATGLAHLGSDVVLVALCDADDSWEEGALAASLAALAAVPEAGWAFGRALVVGPDGRPTGERWPEPPAGRLDVAAFASVVYASNPVPTSSVVLRRDALAQAGGFPSAVRVAEDWDLWLRLCAARQDAVCVAGCTVRYRRHPGGLTADVTALALAQLAVHEQHAALVGPRAAHQVIAGDHAALAAGRARDGDRAAARSAWGEVAARRPLRAKERLRRAALDIPLLRDRLGRGDPYG